MINLSDLLHQQWNTPEDGVVYTSATGGQISLSTRINGTMGIKNSSETFKTGPQPTTMGRSWINLLLGQIWWGAALWIEFVVTMAMDEWNGVPTIITATRKF